jgi:hypothetical protein
MVIPFGLKSVGATNHKVMNIIFHDMINHNIEVYIDNIVVKLKFKPTYLNKLYVTFEHIKVYNLKMIPLKSMFGV